MELLVCAGVTATTAASLYVWTSARSALVLSCRDVVAAASVRVGDNGYFDRNDSTEIKKRCVSLIAVALGCTSICAAHRSTTRLPVVPQRWMECLSTTLISGLCPVLLLFSGPILEAPVQFFTEDVWHQCQMMSLNHWVALRNLVVAPLCEEVVFRAIIMDACLRPSGWSLWPRIAISAVCFAAAHAHLVVNGAVEHCRCAIEVCGMPSTDAEKNDLRRMSWTFARRNLCQHLALVTFFGCVNGYFFETVFRRSVSAATLAHACCNIFGFPEFRFLRSDPQTSTSQQKESTSQDRRSRLCLLAARVRRVAAGCAYVAGVVSCIAFVRRYAAAV